MHEGAYFERLFATALVAAVLIGVVVKPNAPRTYAEQASRFAPAPTSLAERPCRVAGPLLTNGFADLNDVLSVSPLGGVTAPGEPLPAPFVRVNTRKGETMFERRTTSALAPARADVIAVERRLQRDADGAATGQSWTVRLAVCENVRLYYDDLDSIDPDLMRRIGGVAALRPVDGSDHLAATTQVRVKPGEPLGAGDGFDVGLEDRGAPPADLVRPERYRANPYVAARVLGAPPALLKAIAVDHTRAQCPLDYLPPRIATRWKAALGDAHGLRKAKGDAACRTGLPEKPGVAEGAWYTDAAHNGATSKVSAVALAPDTIDPERRMIFALHGRLSTLTPDMVALPPKQVEARAEAAADFLTFTPNSADGDASAARAPTVNPPFDAVERGEVACFEKLRANFVGPRINGVILLGLSESEGGAPIMRMEARADAQSCADLEARTFSAAATTFYR